MHRSIRCTASRICAVSKLPIDPTAPVPAGARFVPGGVQPDMQTPTLISWSLRAERQVSPNTSVTVGYVGSHGYHQLVGVDANEPIPTICPAAPCPAVYPANFPTRIGWDARCRLVRITFPWAHRRLIRRRLWRTPGHGFRRERVHITRCKLDVRRRFGHGLSLRGVYTLSKALDDGDSLNQTTAGNAPGLVSNPYNLAADKGLATYDVRNVAVINALYELPFGRGKWIANGWDGWGNGLVSGWSVASVVTLQGGFPFTPQLSYNPTNSGDTRNPVRPFVNPDFTGKVITGNPSQWFNPAAFLQPPNNSGFYGNLGRDTFTGPGLATWDFSVLKDTRIRERLSLQFRAEIFNLLNRANFNTPNLIVFTPSGVSGTAGAITSTSTTSRQVQFGLKLKW